MENNRRCFILKLHTFVTVYRLKLIMNIQTALYLMVHAWCTGCFRKNISRWILSSSPTNIW